MTFLVKTAVVNTVFDRPACGKPRAFLRPLLLGLLVFLSLGSVSSQADNTVQSLRYGASLFQFYQQDYFSALTELMVAQQLDELNEHSQGAQLLRGGMSLSYGMDRAAERSFRGLLATADDYVDRDQAWFYLGKMAWQRGDMARTADALAQISAGYDGELGDEAHYLRASTQLNLGHTEDARTQARVLPEDSKWRYYLNYNLGATHAAAGDWSAATGYFNALMDMPLETAEARALQDKGLTAAGFAYFSAGAFDQAQQAFRLVRLDSPMSDRALLGYGWSSVELGDFQAALSPWQLLTQRSMLGESARESLLAVPYAYRELGRPGIALEQYRVASGIYTAELAGVQRAIDAFSTEPLGPLLGIAQEGAGDWFFDVSILPTGDHTPYLQHLIARHNFQVALRELQDLYSIASHLQRAGERLQVLDQVDEHQQLIWSSVAQGDRRNTLAQRQQQLSRELEVLQKRLKTAISGPDCRLLVDKQQAAHWQKLEQASALAARIDTRGSHTQKLRLLRGLMLWQDNENCPARLWQAQRELQELQASAAESTTILQRIDTTIVQKQQSNFSPRIAALDEKVQAQAKQVQKTVGLSEAGLRQLAIAELERQADQLARALGQSELAIAHLYDQGSGELLR